MYGSSASWTRAAKAKPSWRSRRGRGRAGRTTRTISRRTEAPSARWWRTLNDTAEANARREREGSPSAGVKAIRASRSVPAVSDVATSWSSALTSTLSTSRPRRASSRAMTHARSRSRTGPRADRRRRGREWRPPPVVPRAAKDSLRARNPPDGGQLFSCQAQWFLFGPERSAGSVWSNSSAAGGTGRPSRRDAEAREDELLEEDPDEEGAQSHAASPLISGSGRRGASNVRT